MVDEPPRRFREEHDEHSEETGWDELNSQGYAPFITATSGDVRVGGIAHPTGDQGTDAQHELLQSGDSTTDIGMCEFGLIEGNDHDQEAYANASKCCEKRRQKSTTGVILSCASHLFQRKDNSSPELQSEDHRQA